MPTLYIHPHSTRVTTKLLRFLICIAVSLVFLGVDGYYTILNIDPGVYSVCASFVGYAAAVVEEVRVQVDLTNTVDIEMQEETVGLDEVVVQFREPVVKPDVSANVANMSSEDMENMPISNLEDMVGLQAVVRGIADRITIWGRRTSTQVVKSRQRSIYPAPTVSSGRRIESKKWMSGPKRISGTRVCGSTTEMRCAERGVSTMQRKPTATS